LAATLIDYSSNARLAGVSRPMRALKAKARVTFVTIVPSPYQRDLVAALASRDDIDLTVCYMEAASPDSPWPGMPQRPFERILPGFWVPFRGARWHFNWRLRDIADADFVVLSTFSSWTGQWLMRRALPGKRWIFWGERLRTQPAGWRDTVQRSLAAPLARATAIVGIGRAAEEDYRQRFPGPRHFCIPYHCDLSAFLASPRQTSTRSGVTFLFCGQMIPRKGVDLLLAAFERLVAKGIDASLLLVGREADLPKFLAAVSSAARSRITYEGFQPPERLPEYFARADVFVLPSRHDGWGVVINQALGAGLPVISSDAVGAGMDLVKTDINGLRFAAGDVHGLEHAMQILATNPELAREWGDASRRQALDITPAAGAEKWAHVFAAITKEK
jgi:glycosyltransferase involved in cell wall biosynthesis